MAAFRSRSFKPSPRERHTHSVNACTKACRWLNLVSTIWRQAEFLYVGIAGRGLDLNADHKKKRGLLDRLDSHRAGRRSGDQFAVYVCDRLVLPTLSPEHIKCISAGELSLDALTRVYIHQHLSYRFTTTNTYAEAQAVEIALTKGASSVGAPLLNPHQAREARRKAPFQTIERLGGEQNSGDSQGSDAVLG